MLTPDSVAVGSFGKLGSVPVDGQVYAQPLYVRGLQFPGLGVRDVVYVATMNDSVYAIDADNPASTLPLWQASLGTPVASAAMPDLTDIDPQIGILSTPVIDAGAQVIYVVTETFELGAPVFRLHGLSLIDGHEMLNGPVVLAASVPGTGAGSVRGTIVFDPYWHLQRPGLALANGAVYVAFGSHGDAGNYHGWVMAYDASNLPRQLAVFNDTPNGAAGGIWQSGRAPAVDSAGNIYVASGNGDFDGVTNFGGCVLKLSGSSLAVLDWYAPAAWQSMNAADQDLGSVGPILLPGDELLITGDKAGRITFLNPASLGNLESATGAVDILASSSSIFQLSIWPQSSPPLIYQHDWDGHLKAYAIAHGAVSATPVAQNARFLDSLYPGMAVSSGGASGGILWETTGNHSQAGVPGTLHAYDASTLVELWNSDMQPRDGLGSFATFAPPLVANGRIYVPTFSNQVVIYGLNVADNGASAAPQITAVLNAASFLQAPVAPGEVVAIFGANLGPAQGQGFGLKADGSISTEIAGGQVLFDGAPAPLLYSSSTQINAVVPFEVIGAANQVVVQYGDASSSAQPVAVAPAAPALFTVSGMGSGEAAIVNQDGTVNSPAYPAPAGSIVSLYATGLGQTRPGGRDGAITGADLPNAILTIQVFISGLPADVLYAGGAPGMVQGVYQINVRVPPITPSGAAVTIVIQAGDVLSPSGTWLAIQ